MTETSTTSSSLPTPITNYLDTHPTAVTAVSSNAEAADLQVKPNQQHLDSTLQAQSIMSSADDQARSTSDSVSAAHATPVASTIQTLDKLTTNGQGTTSSSSSSTGQVEVQQPSTSQQAGQAQSPPSSLASSIQQHASMVMAFLLSHIKAVTAAIQSWFAWMSSQKLHYLKELADSHPTDVQRHAAYLAALNKSNPREVIARVESKKYCTGPAVVVEYLKALVATERLQDYVSSSSTASGTDGPFEGQDHRWGTTSESV